MFRNDLSRRDLLKIPDGEGRILVGKNMSIFFNLSVTGDRLSVYHSFWVRFDAFYKGEFETKLFRQTQTSVCSISTIYDVNEKEAFLDPLIPVFTIQNETDGGSQVKYFIEGKVALPLNRWNHVHVEADLRNDIRNGFYINGSRIDLILNKESITFTPGTALGVQTSGGCYNDVADTEYTGITSATNITVADNNTWNTVSNKLFTHISLTGQRKNQTYLGVQAGTGHIARYLNGDINAYGKIISYGSNNTQYIADDQDDSIKSIYRTDLGFNLGKNAVYTGTAATDGVYKSKTTLGTDHELKGYFCYWSRINATTSLQFFNFYARNPDTFSYVLYRHFQNSQLLLFHDDGIARVNMSLDPAVQIATDGNWKFIQAYWDFTGGTPIGYYTVNDSARTNFIVSSSATSERLGDYNYRIVHFRENLFTGQVVYFDRQKIEANTSIDFTNLPLMRTFMTESNGSCKDGLIDGSGFLNIEPSFYFNPAKGLSIGSSNQIQYLDSQVTQNLVGKTSESEPFEHSKQITWKF